MRSLRVQLAVVGMVAIYAPVLLVLGVDLATDEEVALTADGRSVVTSTGPSSPWTTLTVVALLPAAVALAWWWAGRATRPVEAIRAVADEIGEDDLTRRIGLDRGPSEVVGLAAAFDAMLDRLEGAAGLQLRLIEETSHELRTPLAVLTTTADVLLARPDALPPDHRAALARSQAAAARLATTVDDLLVEARGRARVIDRHPTDLAELVRGVLDEAGAVAPVGSAALALDAPAPVVAAVDPASVHRAVANLVDNALRHAPGGTTVTVAVTAAGGAALVTVTDHGLGLSPAEQERVFDRFWRGERAPGGSGLGLAIARQVAEAHGGTLALRSPGPAGAGCAFTLRLPTG
ncbi:MAG TPA: HAMP domain-containing sensor histidine kinase [Iamia sp.]|nr:HAMP domain-containing sensor histidine kinase [Iamia sp.]